MSLTDMQVPAALIESLQMLPGFNATAFEEVHQSGRQVVSIRCNPAKMVTVDGQCSIQFREKALESAGAINEPGEIASSPIPWSRYGFYLASRPSFTFDPLLHAGAYYVQEASSMFLEQAILQTLSLQEPLLVLDLCAAPGGKSTHIQSLLSADSVLVSNEVIRPRVNILMENMVKWGATNAIITNNDPADFGKLPAMFDAIIIDAPCSGSGLFRKDPKAISEWSEANVALCSQRQQRIIADAWPCLKPGGVLIYSTCSYSFEEDEAIADFVSDAFGAENLPLAIDASWGITETDSPVHHNKGYRFYPYKTEGEGFYLACFKKPGDQHEKGNMKAGKNIVDKNILAAASHWLRNDFEHSIYQHQEQVFAMSPACFEIFMFLQKKLNIRKAGIKLGDWARSEIIPDHALALSTVFHHSLNRVALTKDEAIAYLRKEVFEMENIPKGWVMCMYEDLPLGWIKSLGNRFNNYYPKEWRIRS